MNQGVLAKADRRRKEEAAAAGTAVAANEGRAVYQNKRTGRVGAAASAVPHQGSFRNIKGVSDAPAGAHFSQATHPEGVYNVSTASLARARQKPVARRGQDQLRDTLKTKGFDRPVHMHVYSDGKARIWDGHHRTTRAAELGMDRIPVSVTHVHKPAPKPKSITEGVVALRHHRYRQGLLSAARVAKREEDQMISAFGVDHHLEKGLGTSAMGGVKAVTGFARSAGSAVAGKTNMVRPGAAGSMASKFSSAGTKVGKFTRVNAKPLAVGAGVAGVGGAALGGRRNV